MIRTPLMIFYEINKWAMNLYWMLGIAWWMRGDIGNFGLLMMVISFLYFLSNMVYFMPENIQTIRK